MHCAVCMNLQHAKNCFGGQEVFMTSLSVKKGKIFHSFHSHTLTNSLIYGSKGSTYIKRSKSLL